jgi:hypothetical protein
MGDEFKSASPPEQSNQTPQRFLITDHSSHITRVLR